jgi:hypothetical protein
MSGEEAEEAVNAGLLYGEDACDEDEDDEAMDCEESTEHTCCVCGALITDLHCLSCGHEQCETCPVYKPRPSYDELEARMAELLTALAKAEARVAELEASR